MNRPYRMIMACLLPLIFSAPSHSQNGLRADVLRSDESGATIELSFRGYEIGKTTQNGIEYSKLDFGSGFTAFGQPGQPQLMQTQYSLLAPFGANITHQVTVHEYETVSGIRLLPNPAYQYDESEMPVSVNYEEGPDYRENAFIPAENTALQTSWFRDWRVVNLTICPASYHPVSGQLKIWKRATIRVSFTGVAGKKTGLTALSKEDALYAGLFLNFEQGKIWKASAPSLRFQKTTKNLLASGTWYKIKITEDGFYKLDKQFFSEIGVKISSIDPGTIKIYNNGGNNLPVLTDSLSFADPDNPRGISGYTLTENAIRVIGEADGRFDNNDYALFYGRGTKNWFFDSTANKYIYQKNFYSENNIYWLTFNDGIEGKRIQTAASSAGAAETQNHFLNRYHYENDEANVYQSGLVWVHKPLSNGQSATYPETQLIPPGGLLNQMVPSMPVQYTIKVKGSVYNGSHRFTASVDGHHAVTGPLISNFKGQLMTINADPVNLSSGRVTVSYASTTAGSSGSLDWFEVQYYRTLRMYQNELLVFSPVTAGNYRYPVSLQGASPSSSTVYDITDFSNIREILPLSAGNDSIIFQDAVTPKQPKKYHVINVKAFRRVSQSQVELDRNSDLQSAMNSADYLIITHQAFTGESNRLAAHRQSFNGFRTMVVDVQDVFDEFGAGIPDPVAIRDFIRYAYYRWQAPLKHDKLMYVLLMGDGDYDYRNIVVKSNHNWIPTLQVQSDYVFGSYPFDSRQVDDAFVYVNDLLISFDTSDGSEFFPYLFNAVPDIAVGRIPCNTIEESRATVDKTISFENVSPLETWKHTMTFLSDDEFGEGCESLSFHMGNSDLVVSDTLIIPGYIRKEKIYLSDMPYEMIGSSRYARAAKDRFIQMINRGSSVINYVGHGNPKQLAHERVYVDETDFPLIQNRDRYFYFTNFSCSFAKFDAIDRQGGGEKFVVTPGRGSFALFAATRVVLGDHHTALMREVFKYMRQTGKIGLANLVAKTSYRSFPIENEKYNLLGDPAVTIPYADRRIIFSPIDPPTIKGLAKTTVSGYIADPAGQKDVSFNGDVMISLFDRSVIKQIQSECRPTDAKNITFEGPFIYRGLVKVINGIFSAEFIVPKDISYSAENGKLTALALGGGKFAGSALNHILIDSVTQFINDSVGPAVSVQFEGQQFANGDAVPENPVLIVYLSDSSGINITGSTGHQIQLDVNNRTAYNLTPFYTPERDLFTQGSARITLNNLAVGSHEATLTAFDNANNVTKTMFRFQVIKTGSGDQSLEKISLKNVMNFPNPFKRETHFTFISNHPAGDIEIRIFTVSGRLIKKIEATSTFGYNSIRWDGRDDDGNRLANGIYLYKIDAKSQTDNSNARFIGKMMIAK